VYTLLNGIIGLIVFLSGGYFEPREYDLKEYWTWKGSGRPPWFVRALRQRRNRKGPKGGLSAQPISDADAAESIGTNGARKEDSDVQDSIPMNSLPHDPNWAR
jgi:AGZA family xanthine/uracil permease-like MFS transporter